MQFFTSGYKNTASLPSSNIINHSNLYLMLCPFPRKYKLHKKPPPQNDSATSPTTDKNQRET